MTTKEPPFDEILLDEADLEELCIPLEAEADGLLSTVVISIATSSCFSPFRLVAQWYSGSEECLRAGINVDENADGGGGPNGGVRPADRNKEGRGRCLTADILDAALFVCLLFFCL